MPKRLQDLEKARRAAANAQSRKIQTRRARSAQAYVLSEKYQEALPLLVAATARNTDQPDAMMIYYRGISEYKTGKRPTLKRASTPSSNSIRKIRLSLFYLGQIATAKNDLDGAIATLNRATVNDARLSGAWTLLTSAYLRRAATSTDPAKAEADYLNAVRAGEGLIKLTNRCRSSYAFRSGVDRVETICTRCRGTGDAQRLRRTRLE